MVEFKRVTGKARIRASIEKLFGRVLEKSPISVRIEKWLNPGEYREKLEFVRDRKINWTSTGKGFNQCVYRKIVESGFVTEKGRIRASIEKLLGRVPEDGAVSVRTEKW